MIRCVEFTFKELPFDLEVRHFQENVVVMDASKQARGKDSGEIVDGFFLHPAKFKYEDGLL